MAVPGDDPRAQGPGLAGQERAVDTEPVSLPRAWGLSFAVDFRLLGPILVNKLKKVVAVFKSIIRWVELRANVGFGGGVETHSSNRTWIDVITMSTYCGASNQFFHSKTALLMGGTSASDVTVDLNWQNSLR